MKRGPLGSIDPNSIRETELDTECRRRRERESLNSRQHDRERDATRQRAAATRRRETYEHEHMSARHLSACLLHVSASGAIIAAATANSRRLSQQNPYKTWCFIGRAWPNFPSFYSTFRKKNNKKVPQVWALCRLRLRSHTQRCFFRH